MGVNFFSLGKQDKPGGVRCFEFEQDGFASLAKKGEVVVDIEAAMGEGDEVEAALHRGEGE